MFSGIVEETGKVKRITWQGKLMRLEISASKVLKDAKIGDSIAVNGACLTVVSLTGNSLSFDVIFQTSKNTNLGLLKPGQLVNLERSLAVGDRISGHFVLGHIDCLGLLRKRILRNGSMEFEIAVEPDFLRYCYLKGSVSVNGISLTVAGLRGNLFKVCVIPYTFKNTNLSLANPSDKLNVEFDILAKRTAV
jgi:riboflavin synthase